LSRAKAVVQYLIDEGVTSNRLTSFGYGKSKPLIKSTDENARQINRRVEVRLVR
jgi:chemotaxis protein MotB